MSYDITASAGIITAIIQPLFDAKKNCILPSCGILNITFPTTLIGSTFSSSAFELASPLTLYVTLPSSGSTNNSTIL